MMGMIAPIMDIGRGLNRIASVMERVQQKYEEAESFASDNKQSESLLRKRIWKIIRSDLGPIEVLHNIQVALHE